MVKYRIDGVKTEDFTLPEGDRVGELSGGTTKHRHFVTMAGGEWTYTLVVTSAVGKPKKGKLRFKIERAGANLLDRQKITPGSTLTGSVCVRSEELELEVICSRGTGTKGVRYSLSFSGPTVTEDCPGDAPLVGPPIFFRTERPDGS